MTASKLEKHYNIGSQERSMFMQTLGMQIGVTIAGSTYEQLLHQHTHIRLHTLVCFSLWYFYFISFSYVSHDNDHMTLIKWYGTGMVAAYGWNADPMNGYRQSFYLTAGQFAIDMIIIESIVPPVVERFDVSHMSLSDVISS